MWLGPVRRRSSDVRAKWGDKLATMKSIRFTWRAALVAALLSCSAVLVGACSPSPAAPEVTPARTDLPTPRPGDDERARVTAAYQRFWATTWALGSRPAEEWEPQLQRLTVDPQRTLLLTGYRTLHDNNFMLYGEVVPRVSTVEITGDQARVVDCQDASRSGQADARTGQRKNVGVPRNPVTARLVRDGGDWKVAEIQYPGGTC